MDIPTTAVGAAGVLVALAGDDRAPGNPTAPYDGDLDDTATAWEALTARSLPPAIATTMHKHREVQAFRHGVDLDAPEVLVTLPGGYLPRGWSLMMGDPNVSVLVEDGHPSTGYGPLVTRPAKTAHGKRPRFAVVLPVNVTPGPGEAHALAVAALSARVVADRVEAWQWPARDKPRAAAEVSAYRAFADDAEARIPAAFAWVADLDDRPLVHAFPTVPAVVRGIAQQGTT